MTGRAHLVIAIAAGFILAAHSPNDALLRAGVIGVSALGGLLPDIDHPKSIVSGYLPGVGHLVRTAVSHRGITHSLFFAALCMALLFAVGAPMSILLAAGAGLLSHLAADMTTVQGVPLLLPLSRRAFKVAPYHVLNFTAWALESIATVGAMAVIGLVVWRKI